MAIEHREFKNKYKHIFGGGVYPNFANSWRGSLPIIGGGKNRNASTPVIFFRNSAFFFLIL